LGYKKDYQRLLAFLGSVSVISIPLRYNNDQWAPGAMTVLYSLGKISWFFHLFWIRG